MVSECLWSIACIQFFLWVYTGEKIFLGILKQKISRWIQGFVSETVQQSTSQAVMSESFFESASTK